jgi:hypothetical protein
MPAFRQSQSYLLGIGVMPHLCQTLLKELQTDREAWARAREECRRGGEQLCASIPADTDAKIQAITA